MHYGQIVFNYCDNSGTIYSTINNKLKETNQEIEITPENLVQDNKVWTKLGIQGPADLHFEINDVEFLLGPSGVYEISNYEIKNFKIINPSSGKNIIIDYGY